MEMEMELAEDEVKKFVMVWMSVVVSLCYCYIVPGVTKSGFLRVILTLPVVGLFLLLPLSLTSVHLIGITSFFISWLANFKLLLFAASRGPLSSQSSMSLPKFISLACLPIKQYLTPQYYQHPSRKLKLSSTRQAKGRHITLINHLVKGALLAFLILQAYDFGDKIHTNLLWLIYFLHIYLLLELMLAAAAAIATLFLGMELEPQFKEPLLSSSLQDFWGNRWNLMVTRILRPAVYDPVLDLSTRLVGRNLASLLAVFSTFAVSRGMHELIFYYLGRLRPTFEISAFFLLHGACVCLEIVLKRAVGGAWRPPRAVSAAATIGFVTATGFWLFLPPLLRFRSDERALQEYAAVGAFLRDVPSKFPSANKSPLYPTTILSY